VRWGGEHEGRGATGDYRDVGWRQLCSTHLAEPTCSLYSSCSPPSRDVTAPRTSTAPSYITASRGRHARWGRARGEWSDGGLPRRRVETTLLHPPRRNDLFSLPFVLTPLPVVTAPRTSTAPSYTTSTRGKHARQGGEHEGRERRGITAAPGGDISAPPTSRKRPVLSTFHARPLPVVTAPRASIAPSYTTLSRGKYAR